MSTAGHPESACAPDTVATPALVSKTTILLLRSCRRDNTGSWLASNSDLLPSFPGKDPASCGGNNMTCSDATGVTPNHCSRLVSLDHSASKIFSMPSCVLPWTCGCLGAGAFLTAALALFGAIVTVCLDLLHGKRTNGSEPYFTSSWAFARK